MAYLSSGLQAFAGAVRLLSINILDPFLVYINSWQAYYYHIAIVFVFSLTVCYFLSAKVVVQLASSDCVDAAVMLHPSFITLDEMKGTLK